MSDSSGSVVEPKSFRPWFPTPRREREGWGTHEHYNYFSVTNFSTNSE